MARVAPYMLSAIANGQDSITRACLKGSLEAVERFDAVNGFLFSRSL
jgi:hypothetical protein